MLSLCCPYVAAIATTGAIGNTYRQYHRQYLSRLDLCVHAHKDERETNCKGKALKLLIN